MTSNLNKPKLLLHICCAPDSTAVFDRLKNDYDVYGFFYNPNIYPESEYDLRLNEAEKVSKLMGFPMFLSDYNPDAWNQAITGYESEPEGGKRCNICFEYRLNKTAKTAKENNFDFFSSTLTISPHKNSKFLIDLGKTFSKQYEINFLDDDFKKKDGFLKSLKLSKEYNLYRQNYCGCRYSIY